MLPDPMMLDNATADPDVSDVFGPDGARGITTSAQEPARPLGCTGPLPRPGMSASHSWRDQNQLPVDVRAQQILDWARDEGVERRRDWDQERRRAREWVEDQLSKDDSGVDTTTLLLDARNALQVHDLFEDYHRNRGLAKLKVFDPATLPRYRARLDYRDEHPIQLGTWSPGRRASTALKKPVRDQSRPFTEVNNMWKTEAEKELDLDPSLDAQQPGHLAALAQAQATLWERQPGDGNNPGADNLALRESDFYQRCVGIDNSAGLQGWTHLERDAADGTSFWTRRLWDGTVLQNTAACFAAERGTRRAGLQAALRQFPNTENRLAASASGGALLVLPLEETDLPNLEDVRRRAGVGSGRPMEIPSLPAGQMRATQGKMDPQGYTANMAQFWRRVRGGMEEARGLYMASGDGQRASDNPDVPLPPGSIFGPYAWRGVSPDAELQQDMLRQMRGLKRLFDRERDIAPRQLLTQMEQWYQRGNSRGLAPKWLVARDLEPKSRSIRGLDQIEMEWIRFLLNQSMTAGMVDDLQPRTTLFILFAERLSRIFNDPGDTLFRKRDTSVSIEELISHMAKMKGPVEKTVFYPYDARLWLERLHAQGRCRYAEDPRAYGRVQRPLPTYFPEDLIVWRARTDAQADPDGHPEDMIYAPRPDDDCRTWRDLVDQAQGRAPALDDDVAHYFHCLAYRWGHAMRVLAPKEKRPPARRRTAFSAAAPETWLTQPPLAFARMQDALSGFEQRFRTVMRWDDNDDDAAAVRRGQQSTVVRMGAVENSPLVEVMQRTLGRARDTTTATATQQQQQQQRISTDAALCAIRHGIIDECARNDGMLFPGRSTDYADPDAPRTRESVWDWARARARRSAGGDVLMEEKRFFGLDRWPLQLQSDHVRRRIARGVDQAQVWDPYVEDPTPWTYYYRPEEARRCLDDGDGPRFSAGHRIFVVGDTARQRKVMENGVVTDGMDSGPGVDAAAGDDHQHRDQRRGRRRRPGLFQRLTSMVGLKRRRDDDEDDGENDVLRVPKLPRVGPWEVAPSCEAVVEGGNI